MAKNLRIIIISVSLFLIVQTAFLGCGTKKKDFHLGVIQWTERIEAYKKTYKGILDGLFDRGYKEGINLRIEYQNIEQDRDLAFKTARELVDKKVDLIIALGTGSSLAALKATEEKKIPIVYSVVGDPKATGVLGKDENSRKNITGVSMKIPAKDQLAMVRDVLPHLHRLGILYCRETPQAISMAAEAAGSAKEYGWTPFSVSLGKEDLPLIEEKGSFLAQEVEAIFVPTDPILVLPDNMKLLIQTADKHRLPVIAPTEDSIEYGALMATHCDFYEIGRQAAKCIVDVLRGLNVEAIPPADPAIKKFSLNLKKARALGIEVKKNVIMKADDLIE